MSRSCMERLRQPRRLSLAWCKLGMYTDGHLLCCRVTCQLLDQTRCMRSPMPTFLLLLLAASLTQWVICRGSDVMEQRIAKTLLQAVAASCPKLHLAVRAVFKLCVELAEASSLPGKPGFWFGEWSHQASISSSDA